MTEGFYTDPKYQEVKPKIAVVMTTFLTTRDYGHFVENKLDTIVLNLKAHKHFKPGVAYDLILVNHGIPLESEGPLVPLLDGCIVINRPNEGYSFGGWKQAWETYRETYDFYLFCEDDIAPTQDGWLARILMKFMSDENIGAVGSYVEGRSSNEPGSDNIWESIGYSRDMMYNFDGAFTFTSTKILKQVDYHGGLVVLPCAPLDKRPATINECIFQQPILELGYRIHSFDGFVVHGSEVFTGDVENIEGEPEPLMNLNARRKVPRAAELWAPLNHAE